MLKIGICDDSIIELDQLYNYVNEACEKLQVEADIVKYQHTDALLGIIEKHPLGWDLFFIDMYIDEKTGLDVAASIRKVNRICKIVFVTHFIEPALACFKYDTLAYLLKPVTLEQIVDVMVQFRDYYKASTDLVIESKFNIIRIPKRDIQYIESYGKFVTIYQKSDKCPIEIKKTLDEIHEEMPDMLRCHKSFLVNMDDIVKLDKNLKLILLRDNISIPISRSLYKSVLINIANHRVDI